MKKQLQIITILILACFELWSPSLNSGVLAQSPTVSFQDMHSVGSIRALSFNVRGNECIGRENQIAQYLYDNQIDVFGMQENHCNVGEIAQLWQDKLQTTENPKVTRVSFIDPSKERFRVILTRLPVASPILNTGDLTNTSKPLMFGDNTRWLRGVRVRYHGTEILFYTAHSKCSELNSQVKDELADIDIPYVIMGDFNCSSREMMTQPNSWLVTNHTVTCFYPDAPDSYLDDPRCGPSTKGINTFNTFTPPEEGRKINPKTGLPSGSGPIDHHAVSMGIKKNTSLKLTEVFRIVREQATRFSDHWPIVADIEVFTKSTLPLTAPTSLASRCHVDASGSSVVLSWNSVENATKYAVRLNKQNTCTNQSGQTVEWLCPEPDATGKLGDQFIFVAQSSCSDGTCSVDTPIVPNTLYLDWSVQALDSSGNPSPIGLKTDTTGFTCATITPALDGTYPWTDHGPTSAWTAPSTSITVICNRSLCWHYDQVTENWQDSGAPFSLEKAWKDKSIGGSIVQSIPSSTTFPWNFQGPSVAWENYTANVVGLMVTGSPFAWSFAPTSGWSNSGSPYNLSAMPSTNVWGSIPTGPDNTKPWTPQSGMTSAFVDSVNNIISFCRGTICWRLNTATGKWNANFSDGQTATSIVDLSTAWNTVLAPASDGTTLFSPNSAQGNMPGPVASWTDPLSDKLSVCNGRWCWVSQLAQNTYIATGFQNKNGSGKAQPIDICREFSGGTITETDCVAQSNQRTPATTNQESTTASGDFNNDGAINATDVELLATNLYTTNCSYNLTQNSPPTTDCLITIQDYNELIGMVR